MSKTPDTTGKPAGNAEVKSHRAGAKKGPSRRAINRFITQPDSVDIADVEGWQSKLATKRGVLQGIEVKKIKEFDNILPIFTKGELEGHKIPRQGISP